MKLLLDTCTFLWIINNSSELSDNAKSLFGDSDNEVYLSSISVWEMLVKYQLGRLPLPENPGEFLLAQRKQHRIEALPLQEEAVIQLPRLPNLHKDPFDRILICQAIAHGLTLLTPDVEIKKYPIATTW